MPSLDLSKPVNEYGIVLRWACQTMTDKYFLKKRFIIWCLIIKTHLRAFNNYVDQILPNFDHLPPLEWTFYIIPTLCSRDQAWNFYWPPTHPIVVIEWPLINLRKWKENLVKTYQNMNARSEIISVHFGETDSRPPKVVLNSQTQMSMTQNCRAHGENKACCQMRVCLSCFS